MHLIRVAIERWSYFERDYLRLLSFALAHVFGANARNLLLAVFVCIPYQLPCAFSNQFESRVVQHALGVVEPYIGLSAVTRRTIKADINLTRVLRRGVRAFMRY